MIMEMDGFKIFLKILFALFVLLSVVSADFRVHEFVTEAGNGNISYVQEVITQGIIDINQRTKMTPSQSTALIMASGFNHIDIVKLLLDAGAIVDEKNRRGYTPLMIASSEGHTKIVKLLLDAGAGVNELSEKGETALSMGTSKNNKELINLLLAAGATVDHTDKGGRTALHLASIYGSIDIMDLLITHGANVNAKDKEGVTPVAMPMHIESLMRMAKSLVSIEVLIKAGANINLADFKGRTPLHLAAVLNLRNVAEILLKAGAITSLRTQRGQTPGDWARERGHDEIAAFIDGYTNSTSLQETDFIDSVQQVAMMLKVISRETFLTSALLLF